MNGRYALSVLMMSLTMLSGSVRSQTLTTAHCSGLTETDSTEAALAERLACYNGELDSLSSLMGNLLKERERLSTLLAEGSDVVLLNQRSNDDLIAEQSTIIEQLRIERSDLSAQLNRKLIDEHEQVMSLEAQETLLQQYSDAYLSLSQDNARLTAIVNKNSVELDKLKGLQSALTKKNNKLTEEIAAQRSSLAELSKKSASLNSELASNKSNFATAKDALAKSKALLNEQQVTNTSLTDEVLSLKSSRDALSAQLESADQLLSEQKDALFDLQIANDDSNSVIDKLTKNLSLKESLLADSLQRAIASQKAADANNSRMHDLEQQLTRSTTFVETLQAENNTSQQVIAELGAVKSALVSEIEIANTTQADLRRELGVALKEIDDLADRQSVAIATNSSLTDNIDTLKQELLSANSATRKKLAAAGEMLDASNNQRDLLVKANESLIDSNEALKQQLLDADENLAIAIQELDNTADKRAVTIANNNTLTKSNTQLEKELASANKALAQATSNNAQLEESLSSVTAEKDLATEQSESLRALLVESQNDVANRLATIKSELTGSAKRQADQELLLQSLMREKETIVNSLNKVKGQTLTLANVIQDNINKQETVSDNVQVTVLPDNIIGLKIASNQLFRIGSSALSDEGQQLLAAIADTLAQTSKRKILIEGHSDNIPLGPKLAAIFNDNVGLSTARALSAVNYLIRESDIPAQQLSVSGAGDAVPAASNDTEEGRQQNRRIEILLLPLEVRS